MLEKALLDHHALILHHLGKIRQHSTRLVSHLDIARVAESDQSLETSSTNQRHLDLLTETQVTKACGDLALDLDVGAVSKTEERIDTTHFVDLDSIPRVRTEVSHRDDCLDMRVEIVLVC